MTQIEEQGWSNDPSVAPRPEWPDYIIVAVQTEYGWAMGTAYWVETKGWLTVDFNRQHQNLRLREWSHWRLPIVPPSVHPPHEEADAPLAERVKEVLAPFAAVAADMDEFDPDVPDGAGLRDVDRDDMVTIGDCRKARAILATLPAAAPLVEVERLRAALQAAEDAEDDRDICVECDGEGKWEHCSLCSEKFGRAIELRRAALSTPAIAEVERLRDVLRSIAEGNLGDGPGQANYARLREFALSALSSDARLPKGSGA